MAGTDTGVGKTVVTAALALCARAADRSVVALKPAQTGDDGTILPDATFVQRVVGTTEPYDAVCPYSLRAPLAPAAAASLESRRLDPAVVVDHHRSLAGRYDLVLVEAAGGLLVPFSDGVAMIDFPRLLNLPVVLVVRPGLGTLNHTLLSLEALDRRAITTLGIVIAAFPDAPSLDHLTNPGVLSRLSPVPILGVLPFDPDLDTEAGRIGRLRETAVSSIDPLLGGTFSRERFRRRVDAELAARSAQQ
ncbi:MAG: dethiobiotin synthase [Actinobacteria bacterium]|nr:dethiobiotin synthase [Actinomycetota bacterium]